MQHHTIELTFALQGVSERLIQFVNASNANLVFPDQTENGKMTSGVKNYHQITIQLPKFENPKKVTFSVTNSRPEINKVILLYNCACKLNSCLFLHSVDKVEKKLSIFIYPQNDEDYEILSLLSRRLEEKKD